MASLDPTTGEARCPLQMRTPKAPRGEVTGPAGDVLALGTLAAASSSPPPCWPGFFLGTQLGLTYCGACLSQSIKGP